MNDKSHRTIARGIMFNVRMLSANTQRRANSKSAGGNDLDWCKDCSRGKLGSVSNDNSLVRARQRETDASRSIFAAQSVDECGRGAKSRLMPGAS